MSEASPRLIAALEGHCDDRCFIWMQNLSGEIPFDIVLIDEWPAELLDGRGD